MSAVRNAMSREEVAALVCTTLERHGVHVVLSGGAVVSLYSEEAYLSKRLGLLAP